ncbi:MAG: hypothetical protein D6775_13360 [Caldilineae bacterium]|nr:MAG: hypothetical protein D6775_13360 [Caldilineae bacterium]
MLSNVSIVGSLAGQCAAEQGRFWDMHDWLFENVSTWRNGDAAANVKAAARTLQLDGDAFDACYDSRAPMVLIREDFEEGRSFGARGTPTFFLNSRLVGGLLPTDQFLQLVDALVAQAETGSLPANVATVAPSPTPDTNFSPETVSVLGSPDAPVTMIEFSDYQCPFCLRHFQQTMPQIKAQYIDTGKVRYIFKDFPIASIHPQAPKAAEAAECAGEQGMYWPMHDRLFQGQQAEWNQNPDAVNIFKGYATELGLDREAFDACLDGGKYEAEVAADLNEGIRAGVTGTPSFFINGRFISGAQPFQVFQQTIDSLLNGGS